MANGKATAERVKLEEDGLDLGEKRLRFLDNFEEVKPVLDDFVAICATRIAIAEIPGANLIPVEDMLELPHGTDFLKRYFGNKKRAKEIDDVRSEAREFTSQSVNKAIAPAAALIRYTQEKKEQLSEENTRLLVKMINTLAVLILVLIIKVTSSQGASYRMERARLQNYRHIPHLKSLLGMIIEFDKQTKKIVMLIPFRDRADVERQISNAVFIAKHTKEIIVRACLFLEKQLIEARYNQQESDLDDYQADLVLLAATEEEKDRERFEQVMEGVKAITNPLEDFDRRLGAKPDSQTKVRVAKEEIIDQIEADPTSSSETLHEEDELQNHMRQLVKQIQG